MGRTGGTNNPALQVTAVDATGVNLNLTTAQLIGLEVQGVLGFQVGNAQAFAVDGLVGAPGLAFGSEPTSGFYRIGAGDLGLSVLGAKTLEITATAISAFGSAVAGTAAFNVNNTSTTATRDARANVTGGSSTLSLYAANQNRATAVLTGGPTTPQAALFTTGAIPLVFGVNSIYAGQITSAGAWVVPAATSGDTLTSTGAANAYAATLLGSGTSGQSFGAQIRAGSTAADKALLINNQANNLNLLYVQGNGEAFIQAPAAVTAGLTGCFQVGYLDAPPNNQNGNYSFQLTDRGKSIVRSGAGAATWTIPANASVAFPNGTTIVVSNLSATPVSIAITTDTLFWSPSGTTGTRSLAQFGIATLYKFNATQWLISGTGLS